MFFPTYKINLLVTLKPERDSLKNLVDIIPTKEKNMETKPYPPKCPFITFTGGENNWLRTKEKKKKPAERILLYFTLLMMRILSLLNAPIIKKSNDNGTADIL